MANTTIQLDTERLQAFKNACKDKGLLWRPVLNNAIERETKDMARSAIKERTRKARGAL